MMLRREFLSAVCLGLFAVPAALNAQQGTTSTPTLKELLENGLRASLPEQKAYIDQVVKQVNQGVLKESLVKAVFQRARNRNSEHPFPYFKAMLDALARDKRLTRTP